jgi:preprotein translocase subunit SecF
VSVFTDMYRGETSFDFVGGSRRTLMVSAVLVVLSVILIIVRPFNLSIDFTGGTVVVVTNDAGASLEEVRAEMSSLGQGGARVQLTGDGFIRVQTEALDPDAQDALIAGIADVAGAQVEEITVDAVGPTFGSEVTRRALEALVIFLLVVTAFISWRFEWKMAVAALAALFHDMLITGGIFAAFQFVVSPATVIALLTILGYSLYDTVVVFDKVNENVKELHDRATYSQIVNLSMNEVLMRSINTSLTSLLPVGALLGIGVLAFGAATLLEFALALFVGITVGTYSSIFVATPLLALWKEHEEQWERARRRAERRGGAAEAEPVKAPVAAPEPVPETPAPQASRPAGATPRPPRKRKKRR